MIKERLVIIGWVFGIVGAIIGISYSIYSIDVKSSSDNQQCQQLGGVPLKSQDNKIICAKMDIISVSKDE